MPSALTPELAVRRAACAVVLRHCCMASLTNTIPQNQNARLCCRSTVFAVFIHVLRCGGQQKHVLQV
jgi:hypothetical protein